MQPPRTVDRRTRPGNSQARASRDRLGPESVRGAALRCPDRFTGVCRRPPPISKGRRRSRATVRARSGQPKRTDMPMSGLFGFWCCYRCTSPGPLGLDLLVEPEGAGSRLEAGSVSAPAPCPGRDTKTFGRSCSGSRALSLLALLGCLSGNLCRLEKEQNRSHQRHEEQQDDEQLAANTPVPRPFHDRVPGRRRERSGLLCRWGESEFHGRCE